jgi:glycine/D-amino acid oxidase-like deaminating enzyme/nitrite reductase/ring-hydroxylating ferredoxin subunit
VSASSERSVSYWARTANVGEAPPLTEDQRADVVIIGGGIIGLSTAYELACEGRGVVVLDRGPIGGGMSSRTSAHLASELDDYYHELIALRGLEESRVYHRSQVAALDRIEQIVGSESLDCDFARIDGYLFGAPEADPVLLDREVDAARQIGFAGVEWAGRAPFSGVESGRCLRFPRQARFHPVKYLHGLLECIRRRGGRVFAHSPVVKVEEAGERVAAATESGRTVEAGFGVVATNSPINDVLAIHTKQAPYRTYVIAAPVAAGAVTDALYWDTLDPYHYVRLQQGDASGDVLIIGGEDHKSGEAGDAEQRFADLASWARRHFPEMGLVSDRWSGQVLEPVDYLPYAGRNPGNERIYIATGDSGEGLSNGVAASLLIRDLIVGRANAWAEVYDPKRVTVRAAGEFVRENVDVVASFAERLTGGELASVDDLRPGEGAIIREGLKKIAAFRNLDNRVHRHSAACTHVGCIVKWNAFEQCWDCPCHGSHFAPDGRVLNGPAFRPLAPAD